MSNLNEITLIGRLGHDAEMKTTNSGHTIINMNVATSSNRTNSEGVKTPETAWHKCIVFGNYATAIQPMLKRGNLVFIRGSLHYRTYTDKDNIERTISEITVQSFQLLASASQQSSVA